MVNRKISHKVQPAESLSQKQEFKASSDTLSHKNWTVKDQRNATWSSYSFQMYRFGEPNNHSSFYSSHHHEQWLAAVTYDFTLQSLLKSQPSCHPSITHTCTSWETTGNLEMPIRAKTLALDCGWNWSTSRKPTKQGENTWTMQRDWRLEVRFNCSTLEVRGESAYH